MLLLLLWLLLCMAARALAPLLAMTVVLGFTLGLLLLGLLLLSMSMQQARVIVWLEFMSMITMSKILQSFKMYGQT